MIQVVSYNLLSRFKIEFDLSLISQFESITCQFDSAILIADENLVLAIEDDFASQSSNEIKSRDIIIY